MFTKSSQQHVGIIYLLSILNSINLVNHAIVVLHIIYILLFNRNRVSRWVTSKLLQLANLNRCAVCETKRGP